MSDKSNLWETETWFLLYDGHSPDGRGHAKFIGMTKDVDEAKGHYEKCAANPYSTGYVQIVANKSSHHASPQTDWSKFS